MKNLFLVSIILLLSCKTKEVIIPPLTALESNKNATTIYFVRHAEKLSDDAKSKFVKYW